MNVLAFLILAICSSAIIYFLISAFKKIEQEKTQAPEKEFSLETIKEPFIYFVAAQERSVYYAWSPVSDTLIVTRTSDIMFGNTVINSASVTHKHSAIIRGFLNESRENFVQYEKATEADFFHMFRLVANRTARTFNPILRNQFEAE